MKYRQPINQLEELVMCLDPQDSTSEVIFSDILFTLKEHESGEGVINFFIPGYQRDNQYHELSRWVILDQCIGEYSAVKRIVLYNTFSINQAQQEARSFLI
ncbi:MAG: hypothetical protein PG981_001506 [Wolbachia endosymbiont of Ctenocephalides orientis wCori]|nr:MAG: hypothetical protein PG981_001506 [Wolbachia endosymbiont of Ctenocephalides orientis wCori]